MSPFENKVTERGEQPQLFAPAPLPGALDHDHAIRTIITDAIRRSPKSRDQIADEMASLLGRKLTADMLKTFTAESREGHRWPAAWTHAFCHVASDWRLLRFLAESAGFRIIEPWQTQLLEVGQRVIEAESQQRELTALKLQILGAGARI